MRDIRPTLYLLWGGVAFVLLIGGVNVTNLMLVRSTAPHEGARDAPRARRRASAASPRQLLTETVVLTALGGACSASRLGWLGLRALTRASGSSETPQGTDVALDAAVVAFTLGARRGASALLIALVPVLGAAPAEPEPGVPRRRTQRHGEPRVAHAAPRARDGAGGVRVHAAHRRRPAARELPARARASSPGSMPNGVLTGAVTPPASRYKDDPQLVAFANRLLERVRALPGVEAAGITSNIPLGGNFNDSVILAEGYVMAPGESLISPFNTPRHARLLRGDAHPAHARPALHARRTTRGRRRWSSSTSGWRQRFLATSDPVGRRMWQPGQPRGAHARARARRALLHRRRRRRQRADERR